MTHQWIKEPWARIQIDYIGPLPNTARENKYCLVVLDPFTKWIEAIPTKTNTVQKTAIQLFNIGFFFYWGIPQQIDSDQGYHLTGQVI